LDYLLDAGADAPGIYWCRVPVLRKKTEQIHKTPLKTSSEEKNVGSI